MLRYDSRLQWTHPRGPDSSPGPCPQTFYEDNVLLLGGFLSHFLVGLSPRLYCRFLTQFLPLVESLVVTRRTTLPLTFT